MEKKNDEMTSPELEKKIHPRFGLQFSREKDVKKIGTKYRQLIREPKRVNRLEFSEKCLQENKQFDNVIFTDECSVLLEKHSKLCFRRKWEPPKLKGRPNLLIKVDIWAGISKRGPTKLIVFEGTMDAQFYVAEILSNGLLSFIQEKFPDGYRF